MTFDKEVTFSWKWRPSGACVLFLVNRYLTLLDVIFYSPLLRVGDIVAKVGRLATVLLRRVFGSIVHGPSHRQGERLAPKSVYTASRLIIVSWMRLEPKAVPVKYS